MLLLGADFASSFADASRVRAGLTKMDLVVSHDLFMNETTRHYADIILPGTTWLEDVGVKATGTHIYLMDRILEPAGSNRLAARARLLKSLKTWRLASGSKIFIRGPVTPVTSTRCSITRQAVMQRSPHCARTAVWLR